MKKIYLFLVLAFSLSFTGKIYSQCTETPVPKVLLTGDSWAWFMYTQNTFDTVLKMWGHSNYTFVANSTLCVNGAETGDMIKPAWEAEILNQLTLNPTIDVVHLSIGGNDFLGGWNVSMTAGQTDTLIAQVFVRLDSIIRFIEICRPGIRIFWSGYEYTNFEQVIFDLGADSTVNPYYNTWAGMGRPNFIQINSLQNYVSTRIDSYIVTHPFVTFVNATGLMQYIYGQATALTCPPGGSYPAGYQPLPLGDPTYPSPEAAMLNYLNITKDCFHLSPQSYVDFISYHTQKFYQKFLMDNYWLSDNSAETGTVSSLGNISDTLLMGGSGGENFASVLTFNTTNMLSDTISKASIFLRRMSVTGTNPISGNLQVRVKSGNFGTSVNVNVADFTDAGNATGTPCLFGSNEGDGDWIRLDLPASLFPFINNSAITQFVVSAPGFTGGTVNFYNSSDPDFAPVLNVAFTNGATAIKEVSRDKFTIYPNPTTGMLSIQGATEAVKHVEVIDLLGRTVLQPQIHQNTIDISTLASGMYILNINTQDGRTSQRIIKN